MSTVERAAEPGPAPDRLLRHWRLLLPAVLAPMAETATLLLGGPKEAAVLGPQITAPPPFGLFHDLRWIAVYHNSWWSLALELVAALFLRSLYNAWTVQQAWPVEDRPSMPAATVRAMAFNAIAAVLLAPWAILFFGLAATHFSYLFFAALPPALVVAVVIHRGAFSHAAGRWWRWGPTGTSLGWLLGAFLWLTAAGAVVTAAPVPLGILAAGAAGLLNAKAEIEICRRIALVPDRPRRWSHVMVPVALAAMFAIAVGGTSIGLAVTAPTHPRTSELRPLTIPSPAHGHPVLAAAGFNSHWNPGDPLRLPRSFVAYQFSYRGMATADRIRPYGPADTLQSLEASARRMGEEVRALYRAYGHPVTIVADSEGALVARTYLLRDYAPDSRMVDQVVLLDMPVGNTVVYYPRRGRQGWGVGTGWGLRGLANLIKRLGAVRVSADSPFLRNLVECRTLLQQLATAPPPDGVQEVSFRSLADAVDGSYPLQPSSRTYVITATHGSLLDLEAVRSVIAAILEGKPSRRPGVGQRIAEAVSALSAAWRVPTLAPALISDGSC